MRKAKPVYIVLAALALLATPAIAKSTKAQKADTETEDTPPPCYSYQLSPDGNWAQRPCEEFGTHSPSQHRAPSKNHDRETR